MLWIHTDQIVVQRILSKIANDLFFCKFWDFGSPYAWA